MSEIVRYDDIKTRLLNENQMLEYVNLGRSRGREFAEMCGAKVTFGRRVLYDRIALDKAIDVMTGK